MKRFFAVLVVVAFVVVLPLSHLGTAAPLLKNLIPICHFPDGLPVGTVISVDESAVKVHVELHGDCTAFDIVDKDGSCTCAE